MDIVNKVLEFVKKPLVAGAIGLIIGIIIGLPILGWWLWPVEWKDAAPSLLTDSYKQEYLRMAVQAYMFNQDKEAALQRWNQLGESKEDTLKKLEADPTVADYLAEFKKVVSPEGAPVVSETVEEKEKQPMNLTALGIALGVSCVLLLIVGAALVYFLLIKKPGALPARTKSRPSQVDTEATVQTRVGAAAEEEVQVVPVAQFTPTYKFGDDLFDESNSIDTPSGEFLGEYGVGLLQTIGSGEPSKVAAFEVWLFDKNDAQTVTKVLMSDYAFKDENILTSLESKGEPVLAEPGGQFVLDTATLQLVVRVLDMAYGQGALPEDSFFDHLTLEMTVYQKA